MRTWISIHAAIFVLAWLPGVDGTRAAEGSCPANLILWEASETILDGQSWTFRYLDIRGDLGRYRELEVWFRVPELDPVEARWFVPQSLRGDPWPSLLTVSSRTYSIDELATLCSELEGAGLAEIREAATDMCGPGLAAGSGGSASVTAELRTSANRDGMRYGIVAQPDPDDTRCASTGDDSEPAGETEGSIRVETRITRTIGDPGGDPGDELAGSVHSVIDVWGRFLSDTRPEDAAPQGLGAMPGARRMLALLSTLDAVPPPDRLRSELALAIGAGAPRDYTVALALEVLELAEDREHLLPALLFLGNRPAPGARDDLVAILRRRAKESDDDVVGLALRALLKIDPAVARFEAVALLSDPSRVPRGALGVFALTENGLATELGDLDLGDHDAVREAAVRTVNHIASASSDDDLRDEAAEILRGATSAEGTGSP